ncbi:MAG TPA: hypothetical protein VGK59_03450 [Ohtaekwangia sp.]
MRTLLLTLIFFSLTCFTLKAQDVNVTTIQWNISQVHNTTAGIHDGAGDKLVTYPNDRVEWRDSNNNLKFSFDISSTIGSWSNVNEGGLIHFNFQMQGQPGEVIIQRSGGTLSAEVQLYKADNNPQSYLIQISGYTLL